jgi:hypothetical protein
MSTAETHSRIAACANRSGEIVKLLIAHFELAVLKLCGRARMNHATRRPVYSRGYDCSTISRMPMRHRSG